MYFSSDAQTSRIETVNKRLESVGFEFIGLEFSNSKGKSEDMAHFVSFCYRVVFSVLCPLKQKKALA